MEHGQGRSLRGKCLHLSTGLYGRAGRPLLYAFELLLQSDSTQLPLELEVCLRFFMFAIVNQKWRIFFAADPQEHTGILYTDASACGIPPFQKVVLCFVLLSATIRLAGYALVTGKLLQSFDMKSTYIAHGEALAILFAWFHVRNLVRGRQILHFIDNLGILSAYLKGSSTISDISHLVGAGITMEVSAALRVWREHVDSHANLADAGTRGAFQDYVALKIPCRQYALPPWPESVRHATLDDWLCLLAD